MGFLFHACKASGLRKLIVSVNLGILIASLVVPTYMIAINDRLTFSY